MSDRRPGSVHPPLFVSSRGMAALHIDGVGTLNLIAYGVDDEYRMRYHYVVEDADGQTIHEGRDLCSAARAGVDYPNMMVSLLGFLGAYAEEYRSAMVGDDFYEWCYLHDDELSMARLDLEEVTT